MHKADVLKILTDLYYRCDQASSGSDDGFAVIASAISTAEDVTIREIKRENGDDGHTNIR